MADVENYNNLFLINAPAGSGKTTTIKKRIHDLLLRDKTTTILCITYTNRAADELLTGIESDNVHISTIHSFISGFVKPYFSNKKIIELFFEIYESQIKEKIKKDTEGTEYSESAKRYENKYGKLDYETIKSNIKEIIYNEMEYSSLYYGGLGHNDLLIFSKLIVEKYPIIRKRISSRYRYIFIDEYQDTSAEVLKFFYDAIKGSNTYLYLFGDRMQQIYKNYDGSFEDEFKKFNSSEKLRINYRSSYKIIKILNNIYNNPEFSQEPYKDRKMIEPQNPKVIICNSLENVLKIESESRPNALKLYIVNKKRFKDAGIDTLFTAISNMDKYGFGRKYGAVDILTKDRTENPDVLFRLLFTINEVYEKYKDKNYGALIQLIKAKADKEKEQFFNQNMLSISFHEDKVKVAKKIEKIVQFYKNGINNTICDYLSIMSTEKIVKEEIIKDIVNDKDYEKVLKVPFVEVISLCEYLKEPHVSTQHGVKGEGHDEVFFIAEDNSNLGVKMYEFFKLWTRVPIEFQSLQEFYYEYNNIIDILEKKIGIKISKLRSADYSFNKEAINESIYDMHELFKENVYYCELYKIRVEEFISRNTLKNVNLCLDRALIKGILNAYKLFYVGCSRAKERLTIFIDNEKIKKYKKELIYKLETVGFEISEK